MAKLDELAQQIESLSEEVTTLRESRDVAEGRIAELRQELNDLREQVVQHARFYIQDFKSGQPSIPTWNVRQLEDDPMLDRPWESYGQQLTGGTHIEVTDKEVINCTLLGGTHITIAGEDINHDAVGEEVDYVSDTVTDIVSYLQIRVGRDAEGHVVDVHLITD